ncbi:membrane protein [Mycobacterium phage Iwokeuplikedis]|nr:membrane protein [Mycobacterium phage Iwokeuplikedis]
MFIPAPEEQKKSPNPLFLVLAILSGLPTAFFLLVFVTGGGAISAAIFLWCALWTWVWAAMARRYR